MTSARASDAGFTLVEALVSIFIFGLIASGAVMMLAQGVTTQGRVAEAQAALREVQNARALLAGDLLQYAPREIVSQSGVRPRWIGGDADLPLAFVRVAAEPGESGAVTRLAIVEYVFRDGGVVRRTRGVNAAGDAPMSERVVIADAGTPRFEFFDGTIWREQWIVGAQGAAPPRAVALVFSSPRYGDVRIEALVGLGA
jgi:general secretion pathway protein J